MFKESYLSSSPKADELSKVIFKTISEKKPQSVKQLATMLRELGYREKETFEVIDQLRSQGVLKFGDESIKSVYNISDAAWYLLTIAMGTITSVLVFLIPSNFYPWAYARNVFGLVFVLFLPGYAFVKAILRFKPSQKPDSQSFEIIETIAISISLSLALVSIIGLALYYSPFGLNLDAIVVSLFVFTSIFATVGLLRENKVSKRNTDLIRIPSLE